MPKKTPLVDLDLICPTSTRKRKFVCGECDMTYTLKHYRILYTAEKLSYFRLREAPKKIVCHQCLYSLAERLKEGLEVKKIIVRLNTEDGEVVLKM